jgi:tetratricopeptide (TPR) repeat protein
MISPLIIKFLFTLKSFIFNSKDTVKIFKRQNYIIDSEFSSYIPFDPIENFINKETTNKIKESFNIKQRVWIYGPPGVGKTTTASEFANSVKLSHVVRWFDASTKERIEKSFKNIYEILIGKTDCLDIKLILNSVFEILHSLKYEMLLIFDNVTGSNEIDVYVNQIRSNSNIKFLITSSNQPKTFKNEYIQIEIEAFTRKDVEIYFGNVFLNRFTKDQINQIIEKIRIGNKHTFLNQKIELLASFIKSNKLLGFDELLSVLSKNIFETILTKILLELEQEKDKQSAFEILKFLKYLKFESIDIVLIKDIIGSEMIEKSIDTLINLGIVKMNYYNPDYPSIQFHSLMKQEIEHYIEMNKKQQPLDLFIDLLVLSIPNVDSLPDKNWKMADIYVPYVEYILQITNMKTLQISLLWDARCYYELNVRVNYKNALEALKRSLEIQESQTPQSETKTAALLHSVGLVKDSQSKYEEALDYYTKTLKIYEKLYGDNHPSTADTLNNIGLVKYSQGKHIEALDFFNKALTIYKKVYGDIHISTANTLNNIGSVKDSQSEYEEALGYYSKALKIYEKFYGDIHISTANTLNNIGIVKRSQGKYEEALDYYSQALKIKGKVYGDNHISTADTLNNIGIVKDSQGEYKEALDYYNKALKIKEKVFRCNHPSTANTLNNIGLVKYNQGEYKEALDYYTKAFKVYEKVFGDNHPCTADTLNNIGLVKYNQGEYIDALDYYTKALNIYQKLNPNHPRIRLIENNIDRCQQSLQNNFCRIL